MRIDQINNKMDLGMVKGKPLIKDEVKALLQLIEMSPIITNRTTNATTNKLKMAEWKRITARFNATASTCRRSPQQLRLKWENLKKNSRKRSKMKLNQSSDGTTDCIPPDDILDRVAKLLSSTICDGTIPYGGDIELDEPASGSEGGLHASSCDGSGDEFVLGDIRVQNGVKLQGLQDETQQNGEIIHVWGKQNQSNSIQDNWQTAKHRAQAEYYKKKKEYLDAKMEQILLENIKLKLEIEKLRVGSTSVKIEPL
ncbi:uncharacterized protein LOC120628609 [Pararge aegeria]|uniref:Regulatory protein zeste n=1 Tax=Pararge aegeria TaxID=116150 RepID=S4PY81_9NEOP|nr:uncharacterized protein LOC120628609 [Pararge aegeria]